MKQIRSIDLQIKIEFKKIIEKLIKYENQ